MRLVCAGDCGVDHYRTGGGRLPGGITLNFALHARRSFVTDDEIRVISAVGTDDGATLVGNALENSGIVSDLTTLDGRTPMQYIELRPDGERRFVGYEAGVLARFRPTPAQRAVIERADWLVVPHFVQIADLFDTLLALPRRGRMAVDFADFSEHADFPLLQSSLERIDIAFFGLHDGDTETLAHLGRLAGERNKLLIVTLGASGSRAYEGLRVRRQDAVPVPMVIDTTGAGDAFAAGFLSRYCHGAPVAACLEAGALQAASVIQHLGGH